METSAPVWRLAPPKALVELIHRETHRDRDRVRHRHRHTTWFTGEVDRTDCAMVWLWVV